MNKSNVLLILTALLLTSAFLCAQEKEVPEEFTTEEYLQQFVGQYEDEMGGVGEVKLNEEKTLIAINPSGTELPLAPIAKDEFEVVGVEGVTMKFVRDEEGTVTGAEFIRPSGVLNLKKIME